MRMFAAVTITGQLCACTTVTTARSEFLPTTPQRPAVAPEHVELIFSGHVDRPYQEGGVATLVGERWLLDGPGKPIASLSLADVAAELRNVGANAGCDALLVNPEAPYGRSGVMLSATCVVYPPATAR